MSTLRLQTIGVPPIFRSSCSQPDPRRRLCSRPHHLLGLSVLAGRAPSARRLAGHRSRSAGLISAGLVILSITAVVHVEGTDIGGSEATARGEGSTSDPLDPAPPPTAATFVQSTPPRSPQDPTSSPSATARPLTPSGNAHSYIEILTQELLDISTVMERISGGGRQ
ncbi:uncharacterized protein [Triticum aestivum]|uniref:uncharacterized protein n=1 Tax=Triticum aestivum TaxID=4565 RepID=UPI001D00DB92|nr:uncharacterized protein LOC123104095 [Triticum aestivum]